MSPPRRRTIERLLDLIRAAVPADRRGLVAIDGVDGAGKSHLAEEVVGLSSIRSGRPVIGLSIDGFHHPRHIRYMRGSGPESFYRDSWDASIFIDVPFEISVPRGNQRFAHPADADPESASNHRYVGGQRLYFQESIPWEHATWILDNSDLERPVLGAAHPR